MNVYTIVLEVGNYEAPTNYELTSDLSIMQLYEKIEETKVQFIKVKKNELDYLINVNKIVCIHPEIKKNK